MTVTMGLIVPPRPEKGDSGHATLFKKLHDEEQTESRAQIARREREERHQRLKLLSTDEGRSFIRQQRTPEYYQQRKIRVAYYLSKLPNGWLKCPPHGEELYGIVPSKVPLSEAYSEFLFQQEIYSLGLAIFTQRSRKRHIGLVIDLTNTDWFYPSYGWKEYGIEYVKIRCKGRDFVPDNESVNIFVFEVSRFLSCQKQSKKHVLVHCTDGHNLTGFMIVHYLVRILSLPVTQAIQMFADARPPGIYIQSYIDALFTFYHERKPELVTCPSTPEWKTSDCRRSDWKRFCDLNLNGKAVVDEDNDEDDDGSPAAPVQENHDVDVAMTNDDVLGDSIPSEQQHLLQQFCYQILKINPQNSRPFPSPSSRPVSLDRDMLQRLGQRYCYATWKADGTRYMMLITKDGCYLVDRKFNIRRVQMRFPCKHTSEGLTERCHHFTLLDGEMSNDTVPDSRKQERRYVIYDMMAINEKSLVEMPFSERWKMVEKEVIEPRSYECQNIYESTNPCYSYKLEPFRVCINDNKRLSLNILYPLICECWYLFVICLNGILDLRGRLFGRFLDVFNRHQASE